MMISTPKTCGTSGSGFTVLSRAQEHGGGPDFVAAHEGVGLAVLGHERAEIVWFGDEIGSVGDFHAAVARGFFKTLAKQCEIRR